MQAGQVFLCGFHCTASHFQSGLATRPNALVKVQELESEVGTPRKKKKKNGSRSALPFCDPHQGTEKGRQAKQETVAVEGPTPMKTPPHITKPMWGLHGGLTMYISILTCPKDQEIKG